VTPSIPSCSTNSHRESHIQLVVQEHANVDAMLCDTWVAAPGEMSLRGNVIHGFDGDHEIVLGGFSQVGIASPRVGLMHAERGDAHMPQLFSQRTGTAARLALVQRRHQANLSPAAMARSPAKFADFRQIRCISMQL
jgi:hypothetical protein